MRRIGREIIVQPDAWDYESDPYTLPLTPLAAGDVLREAGEAIADIRALEFLDKDVSKETLDETYDIDEFLAALVLATNIEQLW